LNTKLITGLVAIAVTGISVLKPFSTEKYFNLNTKKSAILVIESPGKEIYLDFCIQCHGANGKGDSKNFPPLDASDWLKNKRTESIAAVKFGQNGEIVVNKIKYNNAMPAMGLSNQEVADVMNYIMTSWSNKQSKIVTESEVAAIKK
jgi:mono/diheme cytochrome c family protein